MRRVFGTRQVVAHVATGIGAGLGVILGDVDLLPVQCTRGAVRVASEGREGGVEVLYGIYASANEATILSRAARAERQQKAAQRNGAAHSEVLLWDGDVGGRVGGHILGDVPRLNNIAVIPSLVSFSIRRYAHQSHDLQAG